MKRKGEQEKKKKDKEKLQQMWTGWRSETRGQEPYHPRQQRTNRVPRDANALKRGCQELQFHTSLLLSIVLSAPSLFLSLSVDLSIAMSVRPTGEPSTSGFGPYISAI
jgi:hypothetical protein